MSPTKRISPLRDALSGLIMAATSIPQLIAYAETVGYASYRGLTTAGPPLLAWGLVTGSPYMNAGVTSITALMAKTDVDGETFLATGHPEQEYVQLVASYSLCVGISSLALALLGFGRVAQMVPSVVRKGFKWGCATGVLMAAIPNGLLAGGSTQLKDLAKTTPQYQHILPYKTYLPGIVNVNNVLYAITHPTQCWSLVPVVIFVAGTVFVMQGKQYLPSFLPPGTEVILVTLVGTLYSMYFDYPGAVVGDIPPVHADAGFYIGPIQVPVDFLDPSELMATTTTTLLEQFNNSPINLAISCTLFAAVNFLSIMGIASGFESENGIAWSPAREMISQGISCLVAALVGSAPVSGSMSRSLVSRMTGTTSQLACIVTALCWITMQPHLSYMSPTPKAALSAVIVSAVVKGVLQPRDLWQLQGWLDPFIGWSTGLATVLMSPTQGFGFGLVLYLVTYRWRLADDETKLKTA